MIVASTKSQFALPEVKRSLVAAAGGLFRLPNKIPHHIAMEMILTGDRTSLCNTVLWREPDIHPNLFDYLPIRFGEPLV
jgi:hypothetical protein